MAEFTEPFTVQKVNTTDWATYRQFIESLRGKTELIYRRTRSNFPILHPEENDPTKDKWFDVVLKTSNGTQVKLRIRRSNLYLDGYQMANSKWMEFGKTSKKVHIIPGSTFLGFEEGYGALEEAANLGKGDKDIKVKRENIILGWKQLEEAVHTLATSAGAQVEDIRNRAKALIVVVQMICESTRFKSILKQLSTKFQDESAKENKAEAAPLWMRAQENKWGDICEELLHTDSDPNHRFEPPPTDTGIKNATDAWEAIGMLKYYKFPKTQG